MGALSAVQARAPARLSGGTRQRRTASSSAAEDGPSTSAPSAVPPSSRRSRAPLRRTLAFAGPQARFRWAGSRADWRARLRRRRPLLSCLRVPPTAEARVCCRLQPLLPCSSCPLAEPGRGASSTQQQLSAPLDRPSGVATGGTGGIDRRGGGASCTAPGGRRRLAAAAGGRMGPAVGAAAAPGARRPCCRGHPRGPEACRGLCTAAGSS